jgi:RNA polymerase sigma factor (sigma-70 family)
MCVRAAVEAVQLATRAAGLGQRTDAQLLADVRATRDPAAFEALVRRHGPLVLAACRAVLRDEAAAEDAFQAAFVALYQSAPAIRSSSVAGWLFRVARWAALRARRSAERRAKYERSATPRETASVDSSWREAVAALHEELDRLPDVDRQPLILCYLEGLSRDEAARRLGWTLNEVRGRLERSRGRLRKRLQKRGIALSAGLLAAVGIETLHPTLICAAVARASRPTGRVAELASAGLVGKAPLVFAMVVVAGLVAATGLGSGGPQAGAGLAPTKELPKAANGKPSDAPPDDKAITGRVVDPDGKPVADATIWLIAFDRTAKNASRTDTDGRFTLPGDGKTDRTRTHSGGRVHLAATKDGFGVALPPERFDPKYLVLKLAKDDVPIHGRILDLQGKPVAGATVTPLQVWATPDDSLSDWLKAIRAEEDAPNQVTASSFRRKASPGPGLAAVKTDAQGHFTFAGVGRERLLRIQVSGPSIATAEVEVITHDLPATRANYDPKNSKFGQVTFHGATFDFAADPTQPFEGIVTAADTGKPIPRAVVHADYRLWIETTADEQGRYRLVGLPPGEHRLVAAPPAGEPFVPRLQIVGRASNEKPVTVDFGLTRGTWVEGTLTDARTKKPIANGRLCYFPFDETARQKASGDTAAFDDTAAWTDAAGRFKIAALPGAGAIGINGPGGPYVSADRRSLQGDSLLWTRDGIRVRWTRVYFASFDALAVVEVDPKKPRNYSFTLDHGETIVGRVLDPDGKPLEGARASRLTEHNLWTTDPFPTERFEVRQITENRSRAVLLWHEERKLGAVFRPKVGEPAPEIRLKPNGSAVGRLLTVDGKPAADRPLEIHLQIPGDFGWGPWFPMMKLRTDAAGRFEIPNLPEGPEFSIRYREKGAGSSGRDVREFRVTSGKETDLGDVKPQP